MLYGWEGNHRSGVAPAICHRRGRGLSTYGRNGLGKGDTLQEGHGTLYLSLSLHLLYE